jgi:mono/diheme cytochrome c family protein
MILAVIAAGLINSPAQTAPVPAAPAVATPAVATPVPPAPAPDPNALKWNTESIDYNPKPGEASAPFTFYVTNVSHDVVSITSLRTSCGCTVAQLPPLPAEPYKLGAGSNAPINVTMDLRGKVGTVMKSINVDTSVGNKALLVRVNMPAPEAAPTATAAPGQPAMPDRAKNIQNALADRQAVFKGDCASCHVEKGKGKMGQELYAASCGICHDSAQRAAMVPDLKVPRGSRDLAFWQKWIMEGKPGTMMPAFAQLHGGPLTQEQVDSLTVYLFQNYPKGPQSVAATPAALPLPPVTQKN